MKHTIRSMLRNSSVSRMRIASGAVSISIMASGVIISIVISVCWFTTLNASCIFVFIRLERLG